MDKSLSTPVPITQTLPNGLYVWYMKRSKALDYKNAQALIEQVLREYKEKHQTKEEKETY